MRRTHLVRLYHRRCHPPTDQRCGVLNWWPRFEAQTVYVDWPLLCEVIVV